MCPMFRSLAVAALAQLCSGQVISDLVVSPQDEARALELKAEHFWSSLLQSAEHLRVEEHAQLLSDTEQVLRELPPENTYVRDALREAIDRVRRTSDALLREEASSAQLAADKLAHPGQTRWVGSSILTAFSHSNTFSQAIRRFVGGGEYSEKLLAHIRERQADILPTLRGTAAATGGVLTDCRLASKRSFDVLKYDLYNKGVPKTPEGAKQIANRIIKVSGEMRSRFTAHIREMVGQIAGDVEGKHEPAAATVVKGAMRAAETPQLGQPGLDQLMNI